MSKIRMSPDTETGLSSTKLKRDRVFKIIFSGKIIHTSYTDMEHSKQAVVTDSKKHLERVAIHLQARSGKTDTRRDHRDPVTDSTPVHWENGFWQKCSSCFLRVGWQNTRVPAPEGQCFHVPSAHVNVLWLFVHLFLVSGQRNKTRYQMQTRYQEKKALSENYEELLSKKSTLLHLLNQLLEAKQNKHVLLISHLEYWLESANIYIVCLFPTGQYITRSITIVTPFVSLLTLSYC